MSVGELPVVAAEIDKRATLADAKAMLAECGGEPPRIAVRDADAGVAVGVLTADSLAQVIVTALCSHGLYSYGPV